MWWIHLDGDQSTAKWEGPYRHANAAANAAVRFSRQSTSLLAEVIFGRAGGTGQRLREYYDGVEYLPGESGWHHAAPPKTLLIP